MYITLDLVRRVSSATTTTKGRRSYTRRRVPQREEEIDYQKILVIGEEMVELQANTAGISEVVGFSVLGYNLSRSSRCHVRLIFRRLKISLRSNVWK
jgi:hypothetical protein